MKLADYLDDAGLQVKDAFDSTVGPEIPRMEIFHSPKLLCRAWPALRENNIVRKEAIQDYRTQPDESKRTTSATPSASLLVLPILGGRLPELATAPLGASFASQ